MKFQLNSTRLTSGYGHDIETFAFNRKFGPRIAFDNDDGTGGTGATGGEEDKPAGEDVSGLKSALQKERDRAKALEKQFSQLQESFKGMDPEKYKQFEQLQAEAEKANQREAELKQNLENQYTTQIQQEQKKAQEWEGKYNSLVKRTKVEAYYQAAGGLSGGGDDGVTHFDTLYPFIDKAIRVSESGEVEVLDTKGVKRFSAKDASKPMTVAELFDELKTHPVLGHCFAPVNNAKGSGMQPNAATRSTQDVASLPFAERVRVLRQQK
jgi:hypothetical protein